MVRNLFPLTSAETGFSIPSRQLIRYGAMPLSINAEDDDAREDFLRAWVTTYLAEEIRAEALVRDLGAFSRFLDVASRAAGQKTNVSALARDAGVTRDSVRGYFDVLVDTLIGHWLPAYCPRAKVKEVALPKFYWFDAGVLNAAAGAFDQPLPSDWDGVLLEHVVLHEIRSYLHYSRTKGSLGYWATPSGSEVDFIWWHGRDVVLIETKHARRPDQPAGRRRSEHHTAVATSTNRHNAFTSFICSTVLQSTCSSRALATTRRTAAVRPATLHALRARLCLFAPLLRSQFVILRVQRSLPLPPPAAGPTTPFRQ